MSFAGNERNQHFISQAEQRLNSANPSARSRNQRIYSFSVLDREEHSIRLDNPAGVSIRRALSLDDLFSFDVLNDVQRLNFEQAFGQYEQKIAAKTQSLLAKIEHQNADIKIEVFDIFKLKFLNLVRNPYSIKKVLNNFSSLRNMVPTDAAVHQDFLKVLNGRQPQQVHLCEQLGISEQDYKEWLAVLFLALEVKNGDSNFLDSLITEFFESWEHQAMIGVNRYTQARCLLSDLGGTISVDSQKATVFNFNLSSNSFIQYAFLNIGETMRGRFSDGMISRYCKNTPKEIKVCCNLDDFAMLGVYNKLTVYQSRNKVFCSTNAPYGVTVSS